MQRNVDHVRNRGRRVPRTAVLVSFLGAITACAPPMRQVSIHPEPCGDSLYVQLKRTHPDSLSERAWQRLQSLDRDCAATRTAEQMETSGMMGMGHARDGRWMGMGLVALALMAIMMTALR